MSETTQQSPPTAAGKAAKTRAARKGFTRRAAALVGALGIVGFSYAMAGPSAAEEEGSSSSMSQEEMISAGQEIYNKSCITCHGANLEGVTDRGPALVGVGEAAVYFQVSTGRMPMAQQGAQAPRKQTPLTHNDTLALSAYIGQYGGPKIPEVSEDDLKEADLAEGGELFRLNCASCHSFTAQGGALSSGKHAPDLKQATPVEIYTAMLTGPQNMPVFGPNQLTNDEKMAIIAYVEMLNTDNNPGGAPIGRTGPVPEGLTIWLAGLGVLLIGTVWIAGKS
ncbi:c-type cytochrome [Epidermidibacterium keratini]|uniref:Cytochrome bc1 complex cytochrome c subunit n=1 Tax=Epidermidibacterium keratini TaxID=1891644 RepID=A0A7L4YIF7_9ACTN|nr:cytochrome c [Epidermidibacterium keratini]QHB99200.1 c-type cytochrome [Epidermidibacterium keratini]